MTTALDRVLSAHSALRLAADDGQGGEGDGDCSAGMMIQAADASLDEACRLFRAADLASCPAEVQQAVHLAYATGVVLDGLMDHMGLADPDDEAGFSRWPEETAFDSLAIRLADSDSDAKKPYGDVTYADPGYQADGKKRYPVDTEAHARAALAYFSKSKNKSAYSASQQKSILAKIKSACRKFGIEVGGEDDSDGD